MSQKEKTGSQLKTEFKDIICNGMKTQGRNEDPAYRLQPERRDERRNEGTQGSQGFKERGERKVPRLEMKKQRKVD